MTNQDHPRDLDASRLELPSFIRPSDGMYSHPEPTTESTGRTVDAPPADPLASLARLISEPPRVPPIADHASKGMREGFERVAQEIVAVAKDGVARAEQNLQEAETFAAIILKSGDLLCATIEAEGVRMLQVSKVMREARTALGGPPPPPEGG